MKTDFNSLALKAAARIDSGFLCRMFVKKAFAPTPALLAAAEHQNYRAAAAILEPGNNVDFLYGKAWDRVQEIAKTDKRFGTLLKSHQDEADRFFKSLSVKP